MLSLNFLQLPALKDKYISLMIDRCGLLPPSEMTLPCHDVCHLFEEIVTHGLPRYRNLFKFERMNSFMKQTLKNRAHGVASMMKNYNTHERNTMSGTLYLQNVAKFHSLCQLQPINGLPFQSLSSYVSAVHVEPPEETGEDRTILYDVPSSNVIELRGHPFDVTLSYEEINFLLEDNMDLCTEEGFSAIKLIMQAYRGHCARRAQWQYKGDVLGYARYLFHPTNHGMYKRVIGNYRARVRDVAAKQQCDCDIQVLRDLVAMEEPHIIVRYVISKCLKMSQNV